MTIETIIRKKLLDNLHPQVLEIKNQSHLHKNHPGSPNTGESHFHVVIASSCFEGLSRIQRHQLVYSILEEEMKTSIHALTIEPRVPESD